MAQGWRLESWIEIVYRLLPRYTTRPRVLFSELRCFKLVHIIKSLK